MAEHASNPDTGPTEAPPSMPYGWIAQWDNNEQKYYYVEISTGKSTWEIPTEPAPGVGTTPLSSTEPSQFQRPESNPSTSGDGAIGERGFGSMALHALAGKSSSGQSSSSFGGLAQSFLSGSGSHGANTSGSHSGGSVMAEQLIGSLFGGKNNTPGQTGSSGLGGSSQSYGSNNSNSGLQSNSLSGMLGGILGGSHGSSQHQNNYGYSSGSGNNTSYSGTAPPPSYQAASHSGTPQTSGYSPSVYQQQHGQQSGIVGGSPQPASHGQQQGYHPQGYQQPQQGHGPGSSTQYTQGVNYSGAEYATQVLQGQGSHTQQQPNYDPNKPFYVGGNPDQYHNQQQNYQPNYPQQYGNQYHNQGGQPHFPPPPGSGQGPYNPQQSQYGGNYGQPPPPPPAWR